MTDPAILFDQNDRPFTQVFLPKAKWPGPNQIEHEGKLYVRMLPQTTLYREVPEAPR